MVQEVQTGYSSFLLSNVERKRGKMNRARNSAKKKGSKRDRAEMCGTSCHGFCLTIFRKK